MKVKLSRNDVDKTYGLFMGLNGSYSREFKYALSKNKKIFKGEIDEIIEGTKSSVEGIEQFESERLDILKRHCEIGPDGNFVKTGPNTIKVLEGHNDDLQSAFLLLEEKYKDILTKRAEELKEINEFMKVEVEIDVHAFNNKDIPEELTQEQYDILFPLIKEEELN